VSKGSAHRFRPTYAGANMGRPYGVVETLAGLRGAHDSPLGDELQQQSHGIGLAVRGQATDDAAGKAVEGGIVQRGVAREGKPQVPPPKGRVR
jgi:hypothetical protein